MQYQIIYCFWLFSFDEEIAADMDKSYKIVHPLVEIAQHTIKEKVVRVIVSTFKVGFSLFVLFTLFNKILF
jgi:V-type H+-transporting ATPase subunit H